MTIAELPKKFLHKPMMDTATAAHFKGWSRVELIAHLMDANKLAAEASEKVASAPPYPNLALVDALNAVKRRDAAIVKLVILLTAEVSR